MVQRLVWCVWSLVAVYIVTITSLAMCNTLLSALLSVESFILRALLFTPTQTNGHTNSRR